MFPGGPLFWSSFEKRVIDHITNEHEEIKSTKRRLEHIEHLYDGLKGVLKHADEQGLLHPRLTACVDSECDEYHIIDGDTYVCDKCNRTLCSSCACSISPCSTCKNIYCSDCFHYCRGCKKSSCSDCYDDGDMYVPSKRGGYTFYCSMSCIPEHKRSIAITSKQFEEV